MTLVDRIVEFLERLTPLARSNLLTELERLDVCGEEIAGSLPVLEHLRAEFRQSGQTSNREASPARYFFAPLEPLLVDGAPSHANSGRIVRGSLAPIWQWINRDLLPMMARDYVDRMIPLIAAEKRQEAQKFAGTFQSKVAKYLEGTLGSKEGADHTRSKLATYTASNTVYSDLTNMLRVLRARDLLAKFDSALPAKIQKFDDKQLASTLALLDALARDNADAIDFALTMVERRLETPWQLILLATKSAAGRSAADIAATRYAIAVSTVLDGLDDRRTKLRAALKKARVMVARDILASIYDVDHALRVRIEGFDGSDWGVRMRGLISEIDVLVEAEVNRFPDEVGHVLTSPRLRSHNALGDRLAQMAWKGRDALSSGAALYKKIVGQPN